MHYCLALSLTAYMGSKLQIVHFICSMKFNSTDTCTCSREQDSKVQLEH